MGKHKGYKNRIEKYFSTEDGQRVLNFVYAIGASIIIIGALFKIIHVEGADIILCIGMGTEALIFALSAFDKPATNYQWEEVFPVLASQDPKDKPDFAAMANGMAANANSGYAAPAMQGAVPAYSNETRDAAAFASSAPAAQPAYQGAVMSVSPQAEQVTIQYVNEMTEMTAQLQRLKEITASLTEAQSVLLNSYSAISDNSGNLSANSSNYVSQMETLNKNITGLNTIYEIQLKSVSAQLDTIDKVNSGLSNIRSLYDNSTLDSYKIRQETEKMTDNLSQLNKVYERMLSAMTMNMQNTGVNR